MFDQAENFLFSGTHLKKYIHVDLSSLDIWQMDIKK